MSLNDQKNKYRALDDWFKTAQGQHVAEGIVASIKPAQDRLQGNILLQMGMCGTHPWLNHLDYRRKWLLSPYLGACDASIMSSLRHLPFERNSIDCIIAPLTIEALGHYKNPLDELDRVLAPMGHMIFVGVNPMSIWGLCLWLGLTECFGGELPSLMSSLILKQSLLNRGYRQCLLETFYYIPPIKNPRGLKRLQFLNEMGKMITLTPAGFYCLIVQKHQYSGPDLIKSRKKQRVVLRQQQVAGLARIKSR